MSPVQFIEPLSPPFMPGTARMVATAFASSLEATPVAAILRGSSSKGTESTNAATTEGAAQQIAPRASFEVVWFTFTLSCSQPGCTNCSPQCISKDRLEYHSPWAKRQLQKPKTRSFEIKLPRSQRSSIVTFLAWVNEHSLRASEEIYTDILSPSTLAEILFLAARWGNHRYENEIRKRIIRIIDRATTTLPVPDATSPASEFVRKAIVLKYLALIQKYDIPGLRKVISADEDRALATTKILFGQHQKLFARKRPDNVRSCVMDWKEKLLIAED